MDLRIRPTVEGDLHVVADAMREEDRAEVAAMSGLTPLESLRVGFRESEPCMTFIPNGIPTAIFGASPHPDLPDTGIAWLLGTDGIVEHKWEFLAGSKRVIRECFSEYPLIMNLVDERNTIHIRWLQWCGFSFLKRHPRVGVEERPFLEFARLTHV